MLWLLLLSMATCRCWFCRALALVAAIVVVSTAACCVCCCRALPLAVATAAQQYHCRGCPYRLHCHLPWVLLLALPQWLLLPSALPRLWLTSMPMPWRLLLLSTAIALAASAPLHCPGCCSLHSHCCGCACIALDAGAPLHCCYRGCCWCFEG